MDQNKKVSMSALSEDVKPTHKLMVMASSFPKVLSDGQAFWERVNLITFDGSATEVN